MRTAHAFRALAACVLLIAASAIPHPGSARVDVDRAQPAADIRAAARPHRALYALTMVESRANSNLARVEGRMAYEWKESCEAWITDQKLALDYLYVEGASMRFTSHFSSWENKAGSSFSFTVERTRNGRPAEEFRGAAEFEDGEGEAGYTLPDASTVALPADTVFPTEHLMQLLAHAEAGDVLYNATLFDGSDETGMMQASAFIGPVRSGKPDTASLPGEAVDLMQSPRRRVRIAFFEPESPDDTPDYEMEMTLHANGVVSDLRIEYEDFTLHGVLTGLEPLERPDGCEDLPAGER